MKSSNEHYPTTRSNDEISRSLLPHARAFHSNYFDAEQHAPFSSAEFTEWVLYCAGLAVAYLAAGPMPKAPEQRRRTVT
jgi:hypothetical protein